MAESKIDLKSILINLTLRLIRDFIDHILDVKKDFNIVKDLIMLVDTYLTEVERAYAAYHQKIENELHRLKKERNEEEEEIILSILKSSLNKKEKIELIDFYKEVPIICKSYLKSVSESFATIDIQNCNFAIFKEGKTIYLKIPLFPKAIEAKIKTFKEFDYIAVYHLRFTEIPQEKRRYIRVIPKETIKVYLEQNGKKIEGLINDISIGGIGIYSSDAKKLNIGDKVDIQFELKGDLITAKGIVRHIQKDNKRAGIEFIHSIELENKIAEYVIEREFEIIKELRI